MAKVLIHRESRFRAMRRGIRGDTAASTATLVDAMAAFVGQRAPNAPPARKSAGKRWTMVAKSLSINGVDVRLQLRVEVAAPGRPAEAVCTFRFDREDDSDALRRRLVEHRKYLLKGVGREAGSRLTVRDVWDLAELPAEGNT